MKITTTTTATTTPTTETTDDDNPTTTTTTTTTTTSYAPSTMIPTCLRKSSYNCTVSFFLRVFMCEFYTNIFFVPGSHVYPVFFLFFTTVQVLYACFFTWRCTWQVVPSFFRVLVDCCGIDFFCAEYIFVGPLFWLPWNF